MMFATFLFSKTSNPELYSIKPLSFLDFSNIKPTRVKYSFEYDGLNLIETQPNGQKKITINNVIGKKVKIIEDDFEYLDDGFLDAMKCNNTNRIEISVYESEDYMLVISRLDNLGKGASGAAVQNMNIMLGLDEKLGLKL